jgi:hypothetical protein
MEAGYGGRFSFWNLHVWCSNLLALVTCFFPTMCLLHIYLGIYPGKVCSNTKLYTLVILAYVFVDIYVVVGVRLGVSSTLFACQLDLARPSGTSFRAGLSVPTDECMSSLLWCLHAMFCLSVPVLSMWIF